MNLYWLVAAPLFMSTFAMASEPSTKFFSPKGVENPVLVYFDVYIKPGYEVAYMEWYRSQQDKKTDGIIYTYLLEPDEEGGPFTSVTAWKNMDTYSSYWKDIKKDNPPAAMSDPTKSGTHMLLKRPQYKVKNPVFHTSMQAAESESPKTASPQNQQPENISVHSLIYTSCIQCHGTKDSPSKILPNIYAMPREYIYHNLLDRSRKASKSNMMNRLVRGLSIGEIKNIADILSPSLK